MLLGAVTACLSAFPAAALVAMVYGFPVPFGGKERDPDRVLLAVVFYGILGGFVVLAGAGAVAGSWAHATSGANRGRAQKLTLIFSGLAALAAAIALAVLDLFIGQW
jgi:hypothetical protein